MRKVAIFFLIPILAQATEQEAGKIAVPAAASPAATLSNSERESLYEDHGMEYAKSLYLENNGSAKDEVRSTKSDALNQKIRARGIAKLEAQLAKTSDKRLRREILHRLAQMNEQQAEVISRRSDLADRTAATASALRSANHYLELLAREYPTWTPDAVLFSLAENHAKLKENVIAEKYYREVINRFPQSPVVADSLLSLGNLYFDQQHFETARAFYRRILDTPQDNLHPYAHYKMAWCYFNERDTSAAVAGLEKAIMESRRISQNSPKKLGVEEEALSDLVLFYAESGDSTAAKEHFERLVEKEKANELRYNLARKLFDDGKHMLAKTVAKQLLDEGPQKEFVNKLYLIMISVAERTKDREGGLKNAEKLATWVSEEKLAKTDASRIETEEYMRHYSEKLHYEAETMKQKEVWGQAKKSYEIYLKTFPDEAETPEVKYRYSVLLMNRKENLNAYRFVSEAIAKMDAKHPRFKEALRLRLQSIEMASKDERQQIPDSEALVSYDAYAKNFPSEDLGVEAAYKAATLSKGLEDPEKAAARFRSIAETHPEHKLAKSSVSEALAILVKAQKWEALGAQSKALAEKSEIQSNLLEKDEELKKRIGEARELSEVKLTENLEQTGKFQEAKVQYEKILADKPSDTMGVYAFTRLASLAEQKLNSSKDAIGYFEALREKYPSSKEARQANLELARLQEKVNNPHEAVRRYLDFARSGHGKTENQAMTNAAVTLESLGERQEAAGVFFELSAAQKGSKDAITSLEAGCNNMLLASYQSKDKQVLRKIHDCARDLSAAGVQPLLWQARGAWALDQMADGISTEQNWKKIATHRLKDTAESDRAYVAMAKLKLLEGDLTSFKELRFSRTNERPEANISKKTRAMEELESHVEAVVKIGTPKQILAARNFLRLAYLDFAEVMESAAVPSSLNEADREELKKSFVNFAKGFREKATALETKEEPKRELAQAGDASKAPADGKPVEKQAQFKLAALSSEEKALLENGAVPEARAAEIYAKKAFGLFQDGRFGEARYFSEKWRQKAAAATPGYGTAELERFQAMLLEKLPETDPMSREF
jgi:cellulose synthase operon protein C